MLRKSLLALGVLVALAVPVGLGAIPAGAATIPAGKITYEFDGPWNCYNIDFYKQAFRVVKQRIDALGAANVKTVWQSATYPKDGDPQYKFDFSNPTHLNDWYPGDDVVDDVVDYVAISSFYWDATYRQYQWACDTPTTDPQTLYDRSLNFARAHGKPAMIAESTP